MTAEIPKRATRLSDLEPLLSDVSSVVDVDIATDEPNGNAPISSWAEVSCRQMTVPTEIHRILAQPENDLELYGVTHRNGHIKIEILEVGR